MTSVSSEHVLTIETETFKTDTTNRLYDYWRGKCGDRERPHLADIELMDLYDIAPFMFIRDVIDDGKDLMCRFWGTEMTNAFKMDCSGKPISKSFTAYGSKNAIEIYLAVLESKLPTRLIGDLGYVDRADFISFEAIMLSLDGKEMPKQHVIGAYKFGFKMDNEDKLIYQSRYIPPTQ